MRRGTIGAAGRGATSPWPRSPGPAEGLGKARAEGAAVLAAAAGRLASLLSDIWERPPLSAKITPV